MARYFIGLMLPPDIQRHLIAFANTLRTSLPAKHPYTVSWNHPADLHCTLLFVGQYDDEHHLIQRMTDVAAQLSPATLAVEGSTHWLGRNSLALAVTGAEQVGTRFVEQLGEVSSDRWAGRRPFYGHVTLGRVRPVPRAADDLFASRAVETMSWQARAVHLVRGVEKPADRRYEVVETVPLGGRTQGFANPEG